MIVDQIASLTDSSARSLHARLTGARETDLIGPLPFPQHAPCGTLACGGIPTRRQTRGRRGSDIRHRRRGLAGAKAAETLREEGFTGRVILVCDERDHPYERPPLSKGYLLGKEERDSVFVHEPAWYARHDIELHLGQTVVEIDRDARTVHYGDDGTRVRYDKLLLATGAEPRRLDVPGTDLAGVHHLRRLAHAERLRGVLAALGRDNGHLVIAGAGWIGLEVAAAAREYGAEVTVVEPSPTRCTASSDPSWAASSPNCTRRTASACASA